MSKKIIGKSTKDAAVETLIAKISKDHGAGSVIMGDSIVKDIQVVPTGSIVLDMATGVGGYPRGRIVEIYGPESSGKTTLAIHALASIQKAGGTVAFIDAEHAFDPIYASQIGLDIDKTLFSQPDYGEQALKIAEQMVESGAVDGIVIDSVAALVPKAELEGEIGDSHMGLQARLMSQTLRKLTGTVKKHNTLLIFINQIRQKIGGMSYGPNETTSGGNALKFYASMRIDVRRIGSVGTVGEQTANKVKVKIVKNKVAPPFRIAEFEIKFGKGIDNLGSILDYGVEMKLIDKVSGGWYSFDGNKIAQGKDNATAWLADKTGLIEKIENMVMADKLTKRAAINIENEDLINNDSPEVSEDGGDTEV